jgi:hypothetical protein
VKPYAEAHNHLVIGELLQETLTWLRIRGRTYHFGRSSQRLQDITVGSNSVRLIPWNRVEIVNELPASFDHAEARLVTDGKGNVALKHGRSVCWILAGGRDAQ